MEFSRRIARIDPLISYGNRLHRAILLHAARIQRLMQLAHRVDHLAGTDNCIDNVAYRSTLAGAENVDNIHLTE